MSLPVRYLLLGGVILFGFLILSCSATDEISPQPVINVNTTCSPFMVNDPEFDFELKRTLSSMYSGGSDLGEVIATASRIKPLTMRTGIQNGQKTADHFKKVGDTAYEQGHLVSAHDAWLRAQTYYRTAEFFLHRNPDDPGF